MSIYPVHLALWFPVGDERHGIMKSIVKKGVCDGIEGCAHCGKKNLHWQKAWGHHSLPWGYGDLWCSKRHYEKYWEKLKRKARG